MCCRVQVKPLRGVLFALGSPEGFVSVADRRVTLMESESPPMWDGSGRLATC